MTISGLPAGMLSIDAATTQLEPWTLAPEQVVEGDPQTSGIVLWQSEDKQIGCGMWECTPGAFSWEYTWDETIYVIEGRASIVDKDGAQIDLFPGAILFFRSGMGATWTVTEKIRKVFHFHSDQGPVEF